MGWDKYASAYATVPEFDLDTTVSAFDFVSFHDVSADKVKKITAADLGVAPLTATSIAVNVTPTGTASWYIVTAAITVTLDSTADDGDSVRLTLRGITSIAITGTVNELVNPTLLGDGNTYNLVYADTVSEWVIV